MPSPPAPAAVFHRLLTVCAATASAYAADGAAADDTSPGEPLATIPVASKADDDATRLDDLIVGGDPAAAPYLVDGLNSMEILRGPSSMLHVQGTSGGMVNTQSTRPQFVAQHELRAEYGDDDCRQFAVDTTGPLTHSSGPAYRF